MIKYEDIKLGESCSLNSFANYTGLKIDEMHLAVEVCMRNTDKYAILENIDQMIEETKKNPHGKLQSYFSNRQPLEMYEVELKLDDLRRWLITAHCYDVMENCNKVMELRRALAEKEEEMKQQKDEMKKERQEWETEKERIRAEMEAKSKEDEWASRVTYDNVVDQIASLEDASKRDDARRVFEPLLKKNQVTQLRRDIKRRAKEMNEEGAGTNITIGKVEGDFNVNKAVKQIGN